MNPWTALLESLHSALVDELTDRHPQPKPELGMPIRARDLSLPTQDLVGALLCEVTFAGGDEGVSTASTSGSGDARGFALLALDSECSRKLTLTTPKLWDALVNRAGGEFMHRKIKPRFGVVHRAESGALTVPKGWPTPARVIWIPFKLLPGACYLGVGV